MTIEELLKPIFPDKEEEKKDPERATTARTEVICGTNIVPNDKLKKVQMSTLKSLKDYLSPTYGPMGSYTQIISGSTQDNTYAKYSKDGLTVLKNILFNRPIETSIKSEVEEVCRYVESRVGDGTTSAVLLSYYIFKSLINISKACKLSPQVLKNLFDGVVTDVKLQIASHGREIELDDIYNICMISTNGNTEVSKNILDIYKEYDLDVDIDVSISTTPETMLKIYDGITFDEGYSDPAYVNNLKDNTADIHDAKVYLFADPVDDVTMVGLFERILYDNVIARISNNLQPIPTVIMCPRLSRDSTAMLNKIIEVLYKYDEDNATQQKPQVLVITNYLGFGEGIAYDIGKLCGCKQIKKYIDPKIEEKERESGDAPTVETIHNFAGGAELVSADANKTKFINPAAVVKNPEIHDSLIKFLENEIITATERKEDDLYIGRVKERLKRLRTNNVEYFIGGIAISDRDALRDLVIDAVKNCRSASRCGVGYAANFEGLRASFEIVNKYQQQITENGTTSLSNVCLHIATSLFQAYYEVSKLLYSTVTDEASADLFVKDSLVNGQPANVRCISNDPDSDVHIDDVHEVLCSIETDCEILEAVKKIIGLMASSNQCILQSTSVNSYV